MTLKSCSQPPARRWRMVSQSTIFARVCSATVGARVSLGFSAIRALLRMHLYGIAESQKSKQAIHIVPHAFEDKRSFWRETLRESHALLHLQQERKMVRSHWRDGVPDTPVCKFTPA